MKLHTNTILLGLASSTALFAIALTANAAPIAKPAAKVVAPAKAATTKTAGSRAKTVKVAAKKSATKVTLHRVHPISAKVAPKTGAKASIKG